MRILKLYMENFKTFRFKTEIDFCNDYHDQQENIVLIGGLNGAGKTTILEAVNICLYGLDNKSNIYDYINKTERENHNLNCKLKLTFLNNEGNKIEIARTWDQPNVYSQSNKELYHHVNIKINDEPFGSNDETECQEFINIQIPQKASQFFFFDGEKIQEYAEVEKFEKKLDKSIEITLGLTHLSKLIDDLDKLKEQIDDTSGVTDEDLKSAALEKEKLVVELQKLQKKETEVQEELDEVNTLLNQKEEALQSFHKAMTDYSSAQAKNERLIQVQNQLEKIEEQILKLGSEILPYVLLSPMFDLLRQHIAKCKENSSLKGFLYLKSEIINAVIPEIKKYLDYKSVALGEAELSELKEILSTRLDKISLNQNEDNAYCIKLSLSECEILLNLLEEIENSWNCDYVHYIDYKNNLENEREQLRAELAAMPELVSEYKKFDELRKEKESLTTKKGTIKSELRNLLTSIENLEKDIEQKEKEYSLLLNKHGEYAAKVKIRDFILKLIKIVKQFKESIQKAKIKKLREYIIEMIKNIAHSQITINDLEIDERNYRITLFDRNGYEISREKLSAGEKQIFAISTLWALAQLSSLNLPIIIDTPLSRLDSLHRENIITRYFPKAGQQVIILSTDTEIDRKYYYLLEPFLSKTLKLEKDVEQGTSLVKIGYFGD